ncbi:hypothetical protein [Emticicia sp. C21]|uniref:hypothetical protein n=1 Tax=Emticicia sp. C21 TaxID=2302915 RepID=UPI000E344A1D|nr:hypothetical protein [Emticicia sp. C21]RFS17225.1 hypothetical protein D0T08_05450 [Emticicia sp. C21]
MKKNVQLLALTLSVGMSMSALAQKDNVGIGTTKPDQSAILDVQSSDKGLLIPRLTSKQINAISLPAKGLLVFQTDTEKSGFYFYDGEKWSPLKENKENSIATGDVNGWSLSGNATAVAGIKAAATASSFIGTPSGIPINFKIGTSKAGSISTTETLLGFEAGLSNVGGGNTAIGYRALKANTVGVSPAGGANLAIGSNALEKNTTGYSNIAIGNSALVNNINGQSNVALGAFSLLSNTSGSQNFGLGKQALLTLSTGSGNTAIGNDALYTTNGSTNTAIGFRAGYLNTGSGNVFLGYQAGNSETGSNKLYIATSSTANPLIKGEFDNKNLKINLGATKSTTVGFLAVGNFETTFVMPTNNSYRLIVQDGIITEKIKVAVKGSADWADYVFEPSYELMPLEKVESFVKENKHLPNVPSAEELSKNGLDVTQTSAKLMEKIEELTLYMIEMNKEIKALKSENADLKKTIEKK